MTTRVLNLRKSLAQLVIPSKLIASSLLIALLAPLGTTVNAQTPATTTPTNSSQSAPVKNPIAEKILGQWETKDESSGQKVTFIFAPKSKLYLLLEGKDSSLIAIEMGYKINDTAEPKPNETAKPKPNETAKPKPIQIDINVSPDDTALTLFEFTPEGKLRLEIDGVNPNQPRPTALSSKASLFSKISDATTIPENAKLIQFEDKAQSPRPNVAIQFVTILSKAQQDYYSKQGKFASNLEELEILTNSETEFYRYQIVPQSDRTQSVIITAQAKDSARPSYTSAVFARKMNGKASTVTGICETDEPSTTPPTTPKAPSANSSEIQCPAGSHLLNQSTVDSKQ